VSKGDIPTSCADRLKHSIDIDVEIATLIRTTFSRLFRIAITGWLSFCALHRSSQLTSGS
jgi:hypothetical protein